MNDKLFSIIKSEVSACICETVCFLNEKIQPETLNKLANFWTDKIIVRVKEIK